VDISSFFHDGQGDPSYCAWRDSDDEQLKSWIQTVWSRFQPFCPDPVHFLTDARVRPQQRFWEMFLGWTLLELGHTLEKPKTKGPDHIVVRPTDRVLVEAVCPYAGTGKDAAVRRFINKHRFTLDRRAMRLRYASALADKLKQYNDRLSGGIVQSDEPYVVALSGGLISDSDLDKGLPEIVNLLFAVSDLALQVPLYSDEEPRPFLVEEKSMTKKTTKAAVDSGLFFDQKYAGFSGVLFSPRRFFDGPPRTIGNDFVFVPNPKANVPLAPDTFRCGRAFMFENDAIRKQQIGPD